MLRYFPLNWLQVFSRVSSHFFVGLGCPNVIFLLPRVVDGWSGTSFFCLRSWRRGTVVLRVCCSEKKDRERYLNLPTRADSFSVTKNQISLSISVFFRRRSLLFRRCGKNWIWLKPKSFRLTTCAGRVIQSWRWYRRLPVAADLLRYVEIVDGWMKTICFLFFGDVLF